MSYEEDTIAHKIVSSVLHDDCVDMMKEFVI